VDLEVLMASEEPQAMMTKMKEEVKKKSIPINIMKCLELTKKQQHNRLEKHLERKP
jgi:hypothetical protein